MADAAPLVSVVIPVFNAADTLAGTVASVQAQSLTDWEALLIEDGSTDESPAICARLAAADPRLRLLRTGGQAGAGPARNAGIAAARGRFIAFLDADDQWHPRKLDLQLAAMAAAGLPFSCTAYDRVPVGGARGGGGSGPCQPGGSAENQYRRLFDRDL
ncbi:glycosyltransferase family 2 protein [Gemmobacter lanyuensis]|uniref:glycosyltransferase family 2 protein n=1 Tax=Gemmobacter lanyuensis TaxID=1054497 RepID=UPI0036157D18